MKTKEDLNYKYIVAHTYKDWIKVLLILRLYFNIGDIVWFYTADFQYIIISDTDYHNCYVWGSSLYKSFQEDTKDYSLLPLEILFTEF